jgi:integrase
MGRRAKREKRKIEVLVNERLVTVTMFPPEGRKKSWYAYWAGLKARKSTGHSNFGDAAMAVNDMLGNGGQKSQLADTVLSDEEFEEIQRRHFGKKQKPDAKRRAEKSLVACMEAISAFRAITGLKPITLAKPEDCERFQTEALRLPKNWRSKHPLNQDENQVPRLSANTVVKWSVALQAAFERANANAGRKCVRSVVGEKKLLQFNPWHRFTWIEGFDREIRQFDGEELLALLDHFETNWPQVTVATAMTKVFLWSWGRRSEVAGLQWGECRIVGNECHFESVGKWGVDKWFRIPEALYRELQGLRQCESPYVFAAFSDQLRDHHATGRNPWLVSTVHKEFTPENLGEWFYRRINKWSKSLPKGAAYIHVFRKTALQYAVSGESAISQVAADARLGAGVMMTSYAKETDEEMRHRSNRTYARILASLRPDVAERFGYSAPKVDPLAAKLQEAIAAQNWDLAARLTAELAKRSQQAG